MSKRDYQRKKKKMYPIVLFFKSVYFMMMMMRMRIKEEHETNAARYKIKLYLVHVEMEGRHNQEDKTSHTPIRMSPLWKT